MESRYNRPSSPRGRYSNPARSSTGTFGGYYDSSYYPRPSSPRTSGDRISSGGSYNTTSSSYYSIPSSSTSSSRKGGLLYDSYSGRPRRNTGEHMSRPDVSSLTSMPIRTPYSPHSNIDTPNSPLAQSWDRRGDTYITQGPSRSSASQHKKVYSVDDGSHTTRLVADIETPRHRDSTDRGYSVTSGGRSYHSTSKAPPRLTDLGDEGYSYTDPASMYRDTEPAWRRPRAGSLERGSRPTSMIVDRPARTSTRELGPPPSTRGFDKINNGISRAVHGRSSSIDRSRDIPKYDPYPDAAPTRSSTTRHPAIHQESRDHRRDTYHDDYDRRDRETENRRHHSIDRFEDRDVASRGFGIATGAPAPSHSSHDHHSLDRQPLYNAPETGRSRPDERGAQYYPTERAHVPSGTQGPEARAPRDAAPPQDPYDKRSREPSRPDNTGFIPAAAGAAAGVAAGIGAAGYMKSRDKDPDSSAERERERDREREREREREQEKERAKRREHDERDRRDRYDDRRRPDETRTDLPPSVAAAAAASAAPSSQTESDRKSRDRRYDDDRDRRSRRAGSDGSGDERPRHYVDRETERNGNTTSQDTAVDPDEDYRRRVQQEAERSGRSQRDREQGDSDRERERRNRKDDRERSKSRGAEERSRYDERSSSIYDTSLVQEPESLDGPTPANKSVQIVAPPKEPQPQVKGILRKPTEKFPEDPEPIREGVAPHKDALKGKDIPVGARWTRIDRRLVNPEALEEAKERFEERMDCVIVLRVLTKEEIQKLADRTKRIRESRDYDDRDDRRDRDRERDRRGYRSSRDDRDDEDRDRYRERERDRDRRRRYSDEESDYEDKYRERERDRERTKMIEPAR